MATNQPKSNKNKNRTQNPPNSNHQLLLEIRDALKATNNRRGRRRGRGRRGRGRRFRRSNMPAAFTSNYNANAKIGRINGAPALISQEVFPIRSSSDPISFMLPLTPTKWTGTRSATLCSTYTAFRPISVEVLYQPAVGTTVQGNIVVGSVFDGASANLADLDRAIVSLPATNGGFISQLYKPMSSRINLATALRYNLFPLYNIGPDDIPAWIVVAVQSSIEANTLIGNIVVRIRASLKNPATNPTQTISSLNVRSTITRTVVEGAATTVMTVAKSALTTALEVGKDYYAVFGKALKNTSDGDILRPLGFMSVNCSSSDETNYSFDLDNNIATSANILTSIIGSSPVGNF